MFDFPNTPTSGQVITGPNGATWQWDGTKWRANALWQGATVIVSDTPPTNPPSGALWWDSIGGQLYLNFQDPNSVEWVIANSGGIPDAANDGGIYARSNQQWVSISPSIAAAPNNVGRNFVQNCQFNIQQRGVGPWTTNTYTADRWSFQVNTDTASVSFPAISDANRTALGDESANFILQNVFTGTSGAAAYTVVYQPIESVRRLANRTVTISFWATASAAGMKLGVSIDQAFGSGGSPSATVNNPGQAFTLTTVWARYSMTFALASLAGKTLGTNNNDATNLFFWYSSGANQATRTGNIGVQSGTIWVYGVQLEVGSGAGFPTQLAKKSPSDDLADCQRFYVAMYALLIADNCGVSGQPIYEDYAFPVTMRASPTVTLNPQQTSLASSLTQNAVNSVHLRASATNNATGSCWIIFDALASADL